ncbi:MAG: 2-C-methyl-D-erythritol 4-phosphate cytidylyltransferase [Aridibacter sp.]
MNTAIIVAAGSGKRFGGHIPKQFIEIHGKPVLIHTLQRFEKCDSVDEIVLVLAAGEINNFSKKVQKFNITKLNKIITGGNSRAESVFNGLKTIDKKSAEIIAVHDGARPLVSVEEISKTIKKAEEHGAACLVGKVTDTIKDISDGKIVKTIDRTKIRRALTPQCFRYEILKRAFEENDTDKIATDECFLIEQMGIEIKIVEGSSKNIKITHEEDLKFAQIFLQK